MRRRSSLRATLMAGAALLLFARGVLADTCCANLPVGLDPRSVTPGDVVRLVGLKCLNPDNTGPLPLTLGSYWLAKGERAAQADPESSGPGLPAELPPVETWHPFATVPDATGTVGDATINVPDLPNGTYQLWWWCDDGSGPGGGIHYSTGPRLAIAGSPATDTAIARAGVSGPSGWPLLPVLALATAVFAWTVRWGPFRSRRAKASRVTSNPFPASECSTVDGCPRESMGRQTR